MEVSDIPKAWRAALASVRLTFPDAVIAGGCLRDREQGVKVKDVDIFISTSGMKDSYGSGPIKSKLEAAGWPDVQVNGEKSYGQGVSSRGIVAVLDLIYPDCPPVNLIAMKNFQLEEFDFGICQIMFDGKSIFRTPDYHHDLAARQFRLVPKVDDASFVRSLGRWARLKEKFPAWTLHLGSRAEDSPFIPPKTMNRFYRGGRIAAADFGVRDIPAVMMQPGDYVVPTEIAERLAKETTARILKSDPISHTSTIHVDAKGAVPSAQILTEMLAAKQQLARQWDEARKSAIIGQP